MSSHVKDVVSSPTGDSHMILIGHGFLFVPTSERIPLGKCLMNIFAISADALLAYLAGEPTFNLSHRPGGVQGIEVEPYL